MTKKNQQTKDKHKMKDELDSESKRRREQRRAEAEVRVPQRGCKKRPNVKKCQQMHANADKRRFRAL